MILLLFFLGGGGDAVAVAAGVGQGLVGRPERQQCVSRKALEKRTRVGERKMGRRAIDRRIFRQLNIILRQRHTMTGTLDS